MTSKKVLIVSSLFYPEKAANSKRMTHLAEDFVKKGFEVDVITGFPYYEETSKTEKFKGKFFVKDDYSFAENSKVNVIRSYTYIASKKTFFRRVFTFLSYSISSVLASFKLRKNKYEAAITISPPFFSCFSIYIISKILGCPYILDIQDIYPMTLIDLNIVKNKLTIRFLEFWEIFLYKRAKYIVVISDGFKRLIKEKNIAPDKIVVVENWADPEIFKYSEDTKVKIRQQLNINGKFVVLFVGTIGICQGLENSIEALKILKDYKDIYFVFLGDGVSRKKIEEYTKENNLNNAKFILRQPHKAIPEFMCIADAYLAHIRNNRLYSVTIPSKTYEYLSMGKPILMSVIGEAKDLVEKNHSGIGIEPENPQSLAQGILKLYENKEFYNSLLNNGRDYIIKYANRENMTGKYIDLVSHINKN